MSGEAMAQMAVDATFAAFGKAATYRQPPGVPGASIPCTILLDQHDVEVQHGSTRGPARSRTFEVRVTEVAEPRKDGVFVMTASGEQLKIQDKPRQEDPERLTWSGTLVRVG